MKNLHLYDAIIDVRSQKEFTHSHIPSAYNLPVLSNEEHQEIGTLYHKNPLQAKLLGASLVCKNISQMLQDPNLLPIFSHKHTILIYCARGGLRSESLYQVLSHLNLRVKKLQDGYKGYRQKVLEILQRDYSFLTLYGPTGCGKSEIIQACSDFSIDLERLAHHYGSSFGSMAEKVFGPQPSQKMFENLLAFELEKKAQQYPLLIEAESKKLGKLIIPKNLSTNYQNSPKILITAPIQERVLRIKNLYSHIDDSLFFNAMQKIKPYISGIFYEEILHLWNKKDFEKIALILIEKYYDKVYKKSQYDFELEHTQLDKSIQYIQTIREMLKS